jgi:hypothetical protein
VLTVDAKLTEGVISTCDSSRFFDQKWFPQFLRDEFVDGLRMILDITSPYQPIAKVLRNRLQECGAVQALDLCSGAGGPWSSLVRHFEISGTKPPEVLLTDKYPTTRELDDAESSAANRIHFLRQAELASKEIKRRAR